MQHPLRLGRWAVIVAGFLPLLVFVYVPATDLPSHVAISSVLWRLLTHDVTTQAYFAVNLQPMPYYLAYAVLTPCVALAGPWLGARLTLMLVAALYVVATRRLVRVAGLSPWCSLAGLFLFYGPLFFWGFVATLLGMPFVMLLAAELLALHLGTGRVWRAAVFAGLAYLSHIVLLLPVLVCVAAYASLHPRARRRLWIGSGATLVALLAAIALRAQVLHFETLETAWHHLKTHAGPFDKQHGRAAHVGFMLLLASLGLGRPNTPVRRFGSLLTVGGLALFLLFPTHVVVDGNAAWGVNFRFLTLAEVGLLLRVSPLTPAWCELMATPLAAWFCVGLVTLWQQFDEAAQPLKGVLQALPPHATVQAQVQPRPFAQAWPPLAQNLKYYYLASHPGYVDGLFAGGHIPIRETGAVPRPGRHGDLGEFDYRLEQDIETHPADADLIMSQGRWRLYRRRSVGHTDPYDPCRPRKNAASTWAGGVSVCTGW